MTRQTRVQLPDSYICAKLVDFALSAVEKWYAISMKLRLIKNQFHSNTLVLVTWIYTVSVMIVPDDSHPLYLYLYLLLWDIKSTLKLLSKLNCLNAAKREKERGHQPKLTCFCAWCCSSVVRATAAKAGGPGFESRPRIHFSKKLG